MSVAEVPPQIRCVACKGSNYPSTSNRPVLGILNYCIPLCGMESETGVQEVCRLCFIELIIKSMFVFHRVIWQLLYLYSCIALLVVYVI